MAEVEIVAPGVGRVREGGLGLRGPADGLQGGVRPEDEVEAVRDLGGCSRGLNPTLTAAVSLTTNPNSTLRTLRPLQPRRWKSPFK